MPGTIGIPGNESWKSVLQGGRQEVASPLQSTGSVAVQGFQVGDEIIVRAGETLELGSELGKFTVPAGTQGRVIDVTSSGARTIEWLGKQGKWALAPQSLRKLQVLQAASTSNLSTTTSIADARRLLRSEDLETTRLIGSSSVSQLQTLQGCFQVRQESPPRITARPVSASARSMVVEERITPRVVDEVIVRDTARPLSASARSVVVEERITPRVVIEERITPRVVDEVIVRDTQAGVGLISPPLREYDSISLGGSLGASGSHSIFPQERTVIREVPRYKHVDKFVDVPRVEARERIVEVPQSLRLDRVEERQILEAVETRREVPVAQYVENIKSVPKVSHALSFREEAVRMNLREEFLQEEVNVNQVEMVREVAVVNEEVRRKQVVKKLFEFEERLEKVQAVTTKEEVYEVLRHQPITLDVEMPKKEIIERIERPISMPAVAVQHRIEEFDVIQMKERVFETPEKIIVEIIKEVPKLVTEYVEKRIPKIVYQYEPVEEEVTYYVTEEEIVYVPEVVRIETIREVAVPVVQYVDKGIPKYILDVKQHTLEYDVPIKRQVGVYDDYVEDVPVVTQQPTIIQEAKEKSVPKYILQAREVLEEARCEIRCQRPKEITQYERVDLVREQPKLLIENRSYEAKKDVFVPVQREVAVPLDLMEEVVELVPQVQTVETQVEELIEERRQEVVALPRVQMNYVLEEVEVDWNLHNRDVGERDRNVQTTVFQIEPEVVPLRETVYRQRSKSPVRETVYRQEVVRVPSPTYRLRSRSPSPTPTYRQELNIHNVDNVTTKDWSYGKSKCLAVTDLLALPAANRREHAVILFRDLQHLKVAGPPSDDSELLAWILKTQHAYFGSDKTVETFTTPDGLCLPYLQETQLQLLPHAMVLEYSNVLSRCFKHHGIQEVPKGSKHETMEWIFRVQREHAAKRQHHGVRVPHRGAWLPLYEDSHLKNMSLVELTKYASSIHYAFGHAGLKAPPNSESELLVWIGDAQRTYCEPFRGRDLRYTVIPGGPRIPVYEDIHLKYLPAATLREHALCLQKGLHNANLKPIPAADDELLEWILFTQRTHLRSGGEVNTVGFEQAWGDFCAGFQDQAQAFASFLWEDKNGKVTESSARQGNYTA